MKNVMSYFYPEMKLLEDIQIQQSVLRFKKKKKKFFINLPSRTSDGRLRIVPLLNSRMTQWKLEFGKFITPHET